MLFSVLLIVSTLALTTVEALADKTSDELKDEKDKTEQEKEENEGKLNATNSTIYSLTSELGTVEDSIEETTSALTQIMLELELLDVDIANKETDIDNATVALNDAILREQEQYDAMKIRIQYLYETGNEDLLTVYMESGSISEALTRADYIEGLYSYDRQMLGEYQDTVLEVSELKSSLETEREELLDLQAEYEEEQASMELVIDELQELSDDYAAKISAAQSQANQYAATIAAQNAALQSLDAQITEAEAEEARKKAEEEAKLLAEAAQNGTGVTVTTTGNVTYDTTPIYNSGGSDLGKAIANYGCQFIGNPYVYGGTSLTQGADCSGFTMSVYKNFGYNLPRSSSAQQSVGREVSYSEAQPGDIICYSGHVAIYIGNGQIVHASTPSGGIKIGSATFRTIITVRRVI
ncbi:MAG: NlpC/P60 family protein [Lachnospiraceae bacterium]|nr:NlpC/P60 family protein [Lachnospiraceae bacterium]